jgi:hypothetical protein
MDLKLMLSKTLTINERNLVVNHIVNHPKDVKILMDAFFSNNSRMCQSSSWVVGKLVEKKPYLISKYLKKMISGLEKPIHNSFTRNVIRTWLFMNFSEDDEAKIFDICMKYICNTKEEIAVRAFSIEVCLNICKKYPDLFPELMETIKIVNNSSSHGIISKCNKVMKFYNKCKID